MRARIGIASLCLALSAPAAGAQTVQDAPLRTSAGHDVRVGAYAVFKRDCSGGTAASVRPAGDQHGGVLVVTEGTLSTTHVPNCGTVTSPAHILSYRPNPGFVGTDSLSYDVLDAATGAAQPHKVVVTVDP